MTVPVQKPPVHSMIDVDIVSSYHDGVEVCWEDTFLMGLDTSSRGTQILPVPAVCDVPRASAVWLIDTGGLSDGHGCAGGLR
jgi:hypothetical protein